MKFQSKLLPQIRIRTIHMDGVGYLQLAKKPNAKCMANYLINLNGARNTGLSI